VVLRLNTRTTGLPVYTPFDPTIIPICAEAHRDYSPSCPEGAKAGSEAAGQISVYIIGAFVT